MPKQINVVLKLDAEQHIVLIIRAARLLQTAVLLWSLSHVAPLPLTRQVLDVW